MLTSSGLKRSSALFVFFTFAVCTVTAAVANSALAASSVDKNSEVVALFQSGNLNGAIELEESILKNSGKLKPTQIGLSHAILAFLKWQAGDAGSAVAQGRQAVKFEPQQEYYQFNLGVMALACAQYETAARAFQAAARLAPSNCLPLLGFYKASILVGEKDRAGQVLDKLSSEHRLDYAWCQNLGEVSLQLDELKLADGALTKAVALAQFPEQKYTSSKLLLLTLLRMGELERATALIPVVFGQGRVCEPELFDRTTLLLSAREPQSARDLLTEAISTFNDRPNSDLFFRLGLTFEGKSRFVISADNRYKNWLDMAEIAYRKAISLNNQSAIYHIALARLLERTNRIAEVQAELVAAQKFDKFDVLPRYLLAGLAKPENSSIDSTGSNSVNTFEHNLNWQTKGQLRRVSFKIDGPTCDCHVSHLRLALRTNGSVAYFLIPPVLPFRGTVFVDREVTDLDAFFSQSVKKAFPKGYVSNTLQLPVTITVVSTENVPIAVAIDADIKIKAGELPASVKEVSKLTVRMPKVLAASR